ncbi:MAG: hypothetical protein JWP97_4755 [Labilithrix sp.]|nr:hypothetical protein [Labilithrix sp.]
MTRAATYRPDIDGLRAVAVLSVVLFHLHVPGFGGGYVGVDVFLVISGYLITGLIRADLEAGTFSIAQFYLRRVRRLGPALLAVTVPVTVAAFALLYPEDMRSFAASLVLQFVALQNVFFLADGEYFRGSDMKPLLHTWTLAVEEQFYLLWPLLLLLTRRVRFTRQLQLLGGLLLGSFVAAMLLAHVSPKAAFFLLPARAWELAAGGLLALVQHERGHERAPGPAVRSAASIAGMAAVVASVVLFTPATPVPAPFGVLPVLGAVLIVLGGTGGGSPVSRALSHPAAVHVGLVSYPLYLWHWPVIAFAQILRADVGKPWVAVGLFALACALAEATTIFVEAPIRSRRVLRSSRAILLATAVPAALLVGAGAFAYLTEGAAWRFPPAARPFLTAAFHARSDRCGLLFRALHPSAAVCPLRADDASSRRVLVWGNSHADMWSSALVRLATEEHAALFLNARNCRATPDVEFCSSRVQDAVLEEARARRVTDVVLASSWFGTYAGITDEQLERSLDEVVARLSALGVRTWMVIDPPTANAFDPLLSYEADRRAPVPGVLPVSSYVAAHDRELRFFETLARSHPRVRVIDVRPAFCGDQVCRGGDERHAWYRDSGHLTDDGAQAAQELFRPVFREDGATGR